MSDHLQVAESTPRRNNNEQYPPEWNQSLVDSCESVPGWKRYFSGGATLRGSTVPTMMLEGWTWSHEGNLALLELLVNKIREDRDLPDNLAFGLKKVLTGLREELACLEDMIQFTSMTWDQWSRDDPFQDIVDKEALPS